MGSKRTGYRKYLFFYITGCIITLAGINGCVVFPITTHPEKAVSTKEYPKKKYLKKAVTLMNKGEFESALKESNRVLESYPDTLGSQALFQMGLIYLHPENSKADYQKSLKYFQKIIKENRFNKSVVMSDAIIWCNVLKKLDNKNRENVKLKKKIKSLNNNLQGNKKMIDALQSEIAKLNDQIKSLKEIDLGIEEKKRKVLIK